MKYLKIILFFGAVFFTTDAAFAQSQNTPVTESQSIPEVLPEPSITTPVMLIETTSTPSAQDANGITYMIIDGRKVYVDSNGIQSLSAPVESTEKIIPTETRSPQNPEN